MFISSPYGVVWSVCVSLSARKLWTAAHSLHHPLFPVLFQKDKIAKSLFARFSLFCNIHHYCFEFILLFWFQNYFPQYNHGENHLELLNHCFPNYQLMGTSFFEPEASTPSAQFRIRPNNMHLGVNILVGVGLVLDFLKSPTVMLGCDRDFVLPNEFLPDIHFDVFYS